MLILISNINYGLVNSMRMRKKKWARPELAACEYFIDEPEKIKGQWKNGFEKEQPLFLELGCGKSPFLAKMGLLHRDINFIGIDMISDVLGVARRNISKSYEEAGIEKVDNIFLSAYNIERIENIFDENDVIERIYINFCNPWPKDRHHKRRLTYNTFLRKYKVFLKNGGEIHFKTDDDELFEDSLIYFEEEKLELIKKSYDVHADESWGENVETEHEMMFSSQGIKIKGAILRYNKD